jgi:hypothetical protein
LITPTTLLSFHGTIEDENIMVSPDIISIEECFHSAILERAENSSH